MPRKTQLYECNGRLIAAYSLRGAKTIARDYLDTSKGIEPVAGPVEYCDSRGNFGTVDGEDCSAVWPKPELIPDLS